MNKFQKEVQRRKRLIFKMAGLGAVSYRTFIGWIRSKLKEDIKGGKVEL